jgi:transposase-like protein
MARRTYTDEEKANALALYAEQGPTAVQDELGIAKGTVAGWARANGVQTVRNERTAAATEAVVVDAAATRAALAAKLWALADKAIEVELQKLTKADLREVVGARTRAIHDAQLLTGEVTGRTETRTVDSVDRAIEELTKVMAE